MTNDLVDGKLVPLNRIRADVAAYTDYRFMRLIGRRRRG